MDMNGTALTGAPKKRGRPPKVQEVSVRITWPRVDTSKGEQLMGDVLELPETEAAELKAKGAAK